VGFLKLYMVKIVDDVKNGAQNEFRKVGEAVGNYSRGLAVAGSFFVGYGIADYMCQHEVIQSLFNLAENHGANLLEMAAGIYDQTKREEYATIAMNTGLAGLISGKVFKWMRG
jgi:hypothetical protein